MASLAPTFGRGAMTNHWVDIKNANVVVVMGGNAAEAHPCGFKWVTEAKAHNDARLIVVDPRFTRSAAVADYYAPIRTGTDIAFLGGLINYLLTRDKIQHEYVKQYSDATFLVDDAYAFAGGLFSGYHQDKRSYDKATWSYKKGDDGYVVVDETLQNPRCVFNLLKQHYARYTPEMVSKITGTPKDQFLTVCEMIAETSVPDKTTTFLYALGWTQHSTGSQMIRTMAMVQILLGNMGMAGGGVNALRGHSNIQGLTDLGLLSNLLPGYMTLPGEKEQDFAHYLETRSLKPLRPGQMSYWQNYPKFHVSLMKSWFGDAATKDNDWCYHWLPKLDKLYDVLQVFELMHQGKMNGYFAQGFNPLAAFPNKAKIGSALANLKFLVVIDPLATETSEFWKNFGEFNDVDPAKIQTEVFRLPSTCFAEEDGSLVSSSRVLQWHYKGADGPGEAKTDPEIMAGLFLKLRELYKKEGGAFPDPILNLTWPYQIPASPSAGELAREYSGKALADVTDPKDPAKVLAKAGEQRAGFALLRDDGSTACGCWLFSGAWSQAGNCWRGATTPIPAAWATPSTGPSPGRRNRRILYNRASCDPSGKPWDPKRKVISWNVKDKKWVGMDVRTSSGRGTRGERGALHHEPRGRGAPVRPGQDGGRPVPGTLRTVRNADRYQPAPPGGGEQSGGASVQGRPGGFRQVQGVPVCRDHLPPDRALPLLDQACQAQCDSPAGTIRRDRRGTGQGEGHQGRRPHQGQFQPGPHRRGGGGDQAHQVPRRRRQEGPHRRHSDPLGLQGGGQERLHRQHPDAVRGRREYSDPRVQVVPGQRR